MTKAQILEAELAGEVFTEGTLNHPFDYKQWPGGLLMKSTNGQYYSWQGHSWKLEYGRL